jgi:hypothetical protein
MATNVQIPQFMCSTFWPNAIAILIVVAHQLGIIVKEVGKLVRI